MPDAGHIAYALFVALTGYKVLRHLIVGPRPDRAFTKDWL